jgi:hypothetical protein
VDMFAVIRLFCYLFTGHSLIARAVLSCRLYLRSPVFAQSRRERAAPPFSDAAHVRPGAPRSEEDGQAFCASPADVHSAVVAGIGPRQPFGGGETRLARASASADESQQPLGGSLESPTEHSRRKIHQTVTPTPPN